MKIELLNYLYINVFNQNIFMYAKLYDYHKLVAARIVRKFHDYCIDRSKVFVEYT